VGYQAGYSNTEAVQLSAIGQTAAYSNITAGYNTAWGNESLYSQHLGFVQHWPSVEMLLLTNTTASNNTAVGYQAGYTSTTAIGITAVGYKALRNNTGSRNSAFGGGDDTSYNAALGFNTTGTDSAAFGIGALAGNTTGSFNTASGVAALYNNTTASNNTAVGYQAGYSGTTSGSNAYLGYQAATRQQQVTAANVASATQTLYTNTTGYQQLRLVAGALYTTNGNENIGCGLSGFIFQHKRNSKRALGHYALQRQHDCQFQHGGWFQAAIPKHHWLKQHCNGS
jgi:trimeric autotransporter adhesin